jgi:hypothetical protein
MMDKADGPHEAEQLGLKLKFQGVIRQCGEAARIHGAGIVHQNLDAAKHRLGGIDQPHDFNFLRQISPNRVNFAAGRVGERVARHIKFCVTAAADHHPHSFFEKKARGFVSDAAAAAGHDGATLPDAEVHSAPSRVVAGLILATSIIFAP